MAYDKILITDDGEIYPYSVTFDIDGYYYQISVVWNDRDGELVVLKSGTHVEFDDDGSWLDFNFSPETLFPNQTELSERDISRLLTRLASIEKEATVYTKEQIQNSYLKYAHQNYS